MFVEFKKWLRNSYLIRTLIPVNTLNNDKFIYTTDININNMQLIDKIGSDLSNMKIEKQTFKYVDFSNSTFKMSWIEKSTFENCIFNKVDFSEFTDHQNIFSNCQFKDCNFNYASIGHKGTKYDHCNFINIKTKKTNFIRPEFTFINFQNCKIKGVDFFGSSFENCIFEGLLDDVWFRGGFPLKSDEKSFGKPKKNTMLNVSFENAEICDIALSNDCDLSTVIMPKDENYLLYNNWLKRLEYLQLKAKSLPENIRKGAEFYAEVFLVHAKSQNWQIVNKKDIVRDHGEEVANEIIKILSEI